MSIKEKIVQNTTWVLVANFVVLVLGFLVRPFIARVLGPTEYGVYALILNTGTMLMAFILLSLNFAVTYFTAKNQSKPKIVGRIISTTTITMLTLSAVFVLPAYYIIVQLLGVLNLESFIVAYLFGMGMCVFTITQAAQQGLERFKAYSATMSITSVLASVLAFAGAYVTANPAMTAIGRFVGTTIPALWGSAKMGLKGAFDRKLFLKMWAYSMPVAVTGIFYGTIVVVDRYILQIFKTAADVGFFDISYALVAATLPISNAIVTTMLPVIIKDTKRVSLFYEKFSQANVLMLSIAGAIIFYFSDIIISLLLGAEYVYASTPLKILAAALPFMALYGMNIAVFLSLKRTKAVGALVLGLVAGSIFFNLLLVPTLSSNGAALANFLTYTIMVLVGTSVLLTKYKVKWSKPISQLILFFLLIASFQLMQVYGFGVKVAVVSAFIVLSFLFNKSMFIEIIGMLKKRVLKLFA